MKKNFFLIMCFLLNLAFASKKNEVDGLQLFRDNITEENFNADYKPNVTGMIVGGSLTGIGLVLVGLGIYELSIVPDKSESLNDAAGGFLGTFCILGSIPFFGFGIPVLSYNIYQYNVRKKQARKCDGYQNALDCYKLRKYDGEMGMFQIMLFPSLNVIDKGGGLKALLLF